MLMLPFGTSCNAAEKAVQSITEGPDFPDGVRATIVTRGGELQVYAGGRFSHWADVSPASPGWYFNGKVRAR